MAQLHERELAADGVDSDRLRLAQPDRRSRVGAPDRARATARNAADDRVRRRPAAREPRSRPSAPKPRRRALIPLRAHRARRSRVAARLGGTAADQHRAPGARRLRRDADRTRPISGTLSRQRPELSEFGASGPNPEYIRAMRMLSILPSLHASDRRRRRADGRRRIPVSAAPQPCAAAAGGGFVWVSEYGSPYLLKIDPRTNKVVAKTGSAPARAASASAPARSGSRTRARTRQPRFRPTGKRVRRSGRITPYDATSRTARPGRPRTRRRARAHRPGPQPGRQTLPAGSSRSASSAPSARSGRPAPMAVIRVDPATNTLARDDPRHGRRRLDGCERRRGVGDDPDRARADRPRDEHRGRDDRADRRAVPRRPRVSTGKVWVPQIRKNRSRSSTPPPTPSPGRSRRASGPFVVTEIDGEAWIPSWKGHDIWRIRP